MPTPDINKTFERVSAAAVREAGQYQPAILADVAGRRGALHGRIQALRPHMRFAGTAFTVEVRPGDNLMIHAALALAQPGDVLVIDGKADQTCALMGTIMMNVARERKLAAVVMDAAARDSLDIEEMDFPVFSVGTNPNGPTKQVGGRIGHPVSVGGVTVHPGDFICGDADGVVVVEREKIESLLPLAAHKVKSEAKRIEEIKKGNVDAPWLQAALVTAGVLKQGETL
ncbi:MULTISPECIES: RraA family protein [unclassified Achromobacter]|uniref:RraA family protein n=1 Tax=unclassified Achromobacter TaxID=2626865 RepID=UPI000B515B9E|nr:MULTISPECIES: methyltransferase [unclassified Achromobacter]OWT77153.1 methyltransferase [Achromobacter sp. HZ28]OWT78034.1 methyltransferase [Achromobacter sp. HZ34]